MGNRALRKITHYGIWQFFILAVAFYLAEPFTESLMKKYIHFDLIELPDSFFHITACIVLAVIWLVIVFRYERSTLYSDRTDGRNYIRDHARYRRGWFELIKYFKDADPYRLDPESLPAEDWHTAEGIILGHVEDRLIKRPSAGVGNLALFALPGGGKTSGQIIPSALRFKGSVLCIDIKGDVLKATKGSRKIKIFSPDGGEDSCHFDPLYGVNDMSVIERQSFIEQIAFIIVQDEKDGKYFTEGGRDFFCGISLYLLSLDLDTPFPKIVSEILVGNAFDWVNKIRSSDCVEAQAYTNGYYGTNEKNVAGAYQTLVKNIRHLSNGGLGSLLDKSENCISPATLEEGYDVYIEIPQDKIKLYSGITAVLVFNFMTAFMKRPDSSSGVKLRPILILLDEFSQYPFEFDTLQAALSTLRSKACSLFLCQQSIAGLSKRYGEEGFRQIIDTCAYISVMSAQDPKSREYFQKLVGTRKVLKISNSENSQDTSRSVQEAREPIFQPEDFGNLDGEVVVIANGKYIKAKQCRWYE